MGVSARRLHLLPSLSGPAGPALCLGPVGPAKTAKGAAAIAEAGKMKDAISLAEGGREKILSSSYVLLEERKKGVQCIYMHTVLRYLGTVAAVVLTVSIVPGVTIIGGWTTALLVALVWSVITMIIRPVLSILTLPITIITVGLFSFILNALLFWAMTLIVPGFLVAGFWAALLGALVLSILSWFIHQVL